jgi:hypothetical protein
MERNEIDERLVEEGRIRSSYRCFLFFEKIFVVKSRILLSIVRLGALPKKQLG